MSCVARASTTSSTEGLRNSFSSSRAQAAIARTTTSDPSLLHSISIAASGRKPNEEDSA